MKPFPGRRSGFPSSDRRFPCGRRPRRGAGRMIEDMRGPEFFLQVQVLSRLFRRFEASLLETRVPRPALGRCRASDRLTGPAACGRAMPTVRDDRLQRGMRRRPARQRARHADCLGAGHRLDFSANFRHAQRPESVGPGSRAIRWRCGQVECHRRPSRPRPAGISCDFVEEKAAGEKPPTWHSTPGPCGAISGLPRSGAQKAGRPGKGGGEAGTVRIASHAPSRATPAPRQDRTPPDRAR